MATFVLIHGASHGGWCWKFVTPLLRQAGHPTYVPTLTGLGERVHLATRDVDLETHIQDIVNVLEYEDLRDVILVGWSYGGTPATGAADHVPERIAHLVYLDADVPRNSETSSTSPERMAQREEWAREFGEGWRALAKPAESIGATLRESLPDETVDWIVSRLVPQPLVTWTHPIHLSNPALFGIPHTFIRCMDGFDETDPDVLRANERMRSEPGWNYREIAADHFAPLTAPALVAEVLNDLVENTPADSR
jgi:pimeloyl-ACP methyl ester carboxylesterase